MGVIDDLYIPSRVRRSDAELDEWTGVAPLPRLKTAPDLSLTMTPKGPVQPPATEAPMVRQGLTMMPALGGEAEVEGPGLLSGAATVLDAMFNPPVVQRIIRYMGGTPIATLEEAIKAGGNEKEMQDWMQLPEGVRNVIESSVSNIHAMGPGKPPGRPAPGTPAAAAIQTPAARQAVHSMPLSELHLDPERFQYKVQQGTGGATGSLAGVEAFDPNLAGVVGVWTEPATGKTFVVNGHNRYALAQRQGASTLNVLPIQADTAEEARTIGALMNIAEGRGSPIDAAKLFRDTGMTRADVAARGLPLREKIAADGLALANLQDSLFQEVIQGQLPLERAIIIGSRIADHDQQLKLVTLLRAEAAKGRRTSNEQVRELADFVQSAPTTQLTQETLFGVEETTVSLALDKARIAAAIRERLATDKALFSKVGKESAAERLTEAGNVINVEASQQLAQQSASLLEIFDKLKNSTGEISTILNDAAKQLQAGGKFDDIRNSTYQRLAQALPEAITGAETTGLGASQALPGAASTSTGDVLSAEAERTRGTISAAGVPVREPPAPVAPGAPPPPGPPPPPAPPETPAPGPPLSESERLRAQAFESPGRFNPARQAASPEVTDLTAAINVRARQMGIMQEQTRGKQTWDVTEQKAHALVQSGQMNIDRILALRPGDVLNAEEGLAARNIRDSAATLFKELLDQADRGDDVAKAGLERAALLASRIETNIEAATGTEIARALAIRRKMSSAYDIDDIYQRMAVRTIDPNLLHEFYRNLTDNTQRQAFTKYFEETSRLGRWVDAFLEARAGGLLSHRSFIRNLGGSGATTMWSIPERAVTAITGGPSHGAYAYEAVEMAYGMVEAQKMALVMAGRAARTGESQFLGAFTQTERQSLHAMSSEALGLTGPMGRAVDVYGEIARVQFRGLVAGDDYFKFINYVGQTRALAYRRYRELISSGTSRQDAAREYEALIANPPPWIREQAEAHSLYTTFNDDIINPVGKLVMAIREDNGPIGKIARLILPFARTPMNVMGYGAERTPGLNFLSAHFWQEMRSGDPIRQDAAAARVALGSSVYMVLATLAGEGYLTGKGPTDPKLRQQYRENGQLPYSVKLPDFPAIPFRGAEPLSQIMAQAADFAELVDQGADLPSLSIMATATVLSSLDYMEDQPMLKSIAQVVDAWRQNDARANEGLMQLFTSFAPVPGLQSTARLVQEQTDPLMRETRTPHGGRSWLGRQVADLREEIAARTPGLSNDLYPQRDILGRPVLRQGGWWSLSPNAPSAQKPHPVMDEINRHNITIGKVPKALGRGKQTMTFVGYDPDRMALELTAKEWDRFQELTARPDDDWPTLDQALRDLIASDRYQEGSDTARGTKATMIKEIFQEYRQEARDRLISEGPVNAQGLTRLEEELEKKAAAREFEQMDKGEQEEARPDLEQQLGRPTRIGILR